MLVAALMLAGYSSPGNSALVNCLRNFDYRILEKLYLGDATSSVPFLILWSRSISKLLCILAVTSSRCLSFYGKLPLADWSHLVLKLYTSAQTLREAQSQ